MVFNKLRAKRNLLCFFIFIVLIGIIKIAASNSFFIEKYYTSGFFSCFSRLLRTLTGLLPFSLGDVLYFFATVWLLYKILRFFIKLINNKYKFEIVKRSLTKLLLITLAVYVIFNIFWGLNYNRKGIAYQLGLKTKTYNDTDLENIQQLLIVKVNTAKQNLLNSHSVYPDNEKLFSRANKCYQQTTLLYPFMKYKYPSVKSSLFGSIGNFLGFTGYYNPFTGEAQINTTVPKFILPYTTCHEMAHQLGYAKEDEANFAGYLAASSSSDTLFQYSTYLDLFLYANHEIYFIDSVAAKHAFTQLSPGVKSDMKEWRDFLIKHRNFADAFVSWAYGKYLKANQQPQGMRTYNEVISDLIAFYKKTGKI